MPLNPGDTLGSNRYHTLRQLGRGGFGFVYLAQDTLLGEQVAIKELIPALVGDEAMLKRFLAEARATMRLRHKCIVATHSVFSENDNYYIVMEYMPGGSLEEWLRGRGPLPVDEAVRVAAEVCDGLACAHEGGVVHCDLKPHNILFAGDGTAKVADFGIAHVSGEMLTRSWHTPAGFVAGTLPYMSPEQTDGVRDDARVDIYALGAILYRMLTGRTYLDFDRRETPRAQADNVQRIYREQPLPPSAHNSRIPAWLDAVILRALSKQRERRYGTAEEMRDALLHSEQTVPALPPTQLIRKRQTAARQGARDAPAAKRSAALPAWFWPAAGAAGVLLVVLVIVIGAALGSVGSPEKASPEVTRTAVGPVTTAPASTSTLTATPAPTAVQTTTPAATDTLAPTDTPRPIPSPTRTATSVPTSANTPQPTPTNTSVASPTSTPKPMATATTGSPTPIPRPRRSAPTLLSPENWADIGDKWSNVTLVWTSESALGPNELYLIEMTCDSPEPWAGQVSFLVNASEYTCSKMAESSMVACWDGTRFGAHYGHVSHWQVTVVRVQDGKVVERLSPASETRSFVWRVP